MPREVPWGAALRAGSEGEGTLKEASVVRVLGVKVELNTRRLLVREEATSVADLKSSYCIVAAQTHC